MPNRKARIRTRSGKVQVSILQISKVQLSGLSHLESFNVSLQSGGVGRTLTNYLVLQLRDRRENLYLVYRTICQKDAASGDYIIKRPQRTHRLQVHAEASDIHSRNPFLSLPISKEVGPSSSVPRQVSISSKSLPGGFVPWQEKIGEMFPIVDLVHLVSGHVAESEL